MFDPMCARTENRSTRDAPERTRSLRVWLVLFNLLFAVIPTVAAASNGGEVVGQIVGGCCVHMASAIIESAASAKKTETKLSEPRRGYPLGETLRQRCLLNDIVDDCFALGVQIERASDDVAAKKTALIYYRHGCLIGTQDSLCEHAERVAKDLGCEDAFACGDMNLAANVASAAPTSAPPPGTEACAADDPCLAPFDLAAAKQSFENVEAALPQRCKNDLPLTKEVRVSVVFEPTGWAAAVWVDPQLEDALIAECVENELIALAVPPFSGDEIEVVKTLSLAEVPIVVQLVQRSGD